MPHLVLDAKALDEQYPAMEVPNDDYMLEGDYNDGFTDENLQRGFREAARIDAAMRRFGRTKCEAMTRPGAGFAKSANVSVDNISDVQTLLYV